MQDGAPGFPHIAGTLVKYDHPSCKMSDASNIFAATQAASGNSTLIRRSLPFRAPLFKTTRDGRDAFSHLSQTPAAPNIRVSFVNLNHINYQRASRCRASSSGPFCASNKLLQELPASQNDEDSYILAVMIALAQQAEANGAKWETRIVTTSTQGNGGDRQDVFSIYTGIVPGALLAMFRDPEKACDPGDVKFTIRYQKVPAWPVLGLEKR